MTVSTRTAHRSATGRRALGTATAGLVLAAGLVACSSDDAQADDGPCAATAASKTDGARSIALPAAEVTVLSPGTGELQPLAVAPTTESPQAVTLETSSLEASVAPTSRTDTTNQVQKTEQQLVTPITARTVCDDPTSLEFRIGTPTSKDDNLDGLLGALDGSTGGLSYAPGMVPTRLRLKPNDASESPARSALEQSIVGALDYAVPLPTTPVGRGAQWRSVRTVSAAATVTQTMTVTLASRDGDVVKLDLAVDEAPVDSVFSIPGSDSKLHIAKFSMSGSGSVTVDLRRLLPVDGALVMKGGRELLGDDPNRPILQQNEFTLAWRKSE
ncbi:hypothetical protein [Gordonia neofelifaecis]|uniref:Lipoprotein n=1 Tax=Gordonia neofelifaecis NRRL B-59395 TaxID=644548 RepID=F1YHN9_9ACTN|nr:hypothetical protein [Gordonia neofelifaecis]EGD55877.1 hypothetical protein SCNU_06535 [Gordonia neofelifaecis NRRL B-59395]